GQTRREVPRFLPSTLNCQPSAISSTLDLHLPRIRFSHRCELRGAYFYIDRARFETLRQHDVLLQILEISETKRQVRIASLLWANLRKREIGGLVILYAFDLDADGARDDRVLSHRLYEH